MAIGSPQWMYASGEAYELDQSLKFEDGRVPHLSTTFSSAGNRRTYTFSCWIKRSVNFGGNIFVGENTSTPSDSDYLAFKNNNTLRFFQTGAASNYAYLLTNQQFRDSSAWYHIVLAVDTTQSTASNRVKIYVNGEQITSFEIENYPTQNQESYINNNVPHGIGAQSASSSLSSSMDGYLSEINFIDGQALTPADFGETGDYGEWKPIEYSGTYGTNGFYLPFKQDYTVEGFSTVTYKGNGGTQYIGGTGFKPNFTWIKKRDGSDNHALYNSLTPNYNYLRSNTTDSQRTNGQLSAKTDGFLLGNGDGSWNASNSYVAWNWDMGADTPTGFGCVTYTGNDGTNVISGFGFQPDLIWTKGRSIAEHHCVFDAVRGHTTNLKPNLTNAEAAQSKVDSFNPDGFTISTSDDEINDNGSTYVAWGWDMGGTTATNTSGSISSQVRANTTYGQSIVTYTGTGSNATVGHGLSSAPEVVIVKDRSNANSWQVFHTSLGNTAAAFLDLTAAADTGETSYWNNTSPTNSLVSLGTNTKVNHSGHTYVAYAFHSVSGYSKFGSYTGNGSSNGTTVTLGFRPAMVIIKPSSSADHWNMYDSTRDPLNPTDSLLFPNRTNAEATGQEIEITDTGFQLKTNNAGSNGNGETYIYLAFAGGMDSISDYNTTGSIDSRVKANPTYGQSIVSYEGNFTAGATVGHGLSSAPEMIIIKNRESVKDWIVYHQGIDASSPQNYRITLNATTAREDETNNGWNDTAPTNSVFSLGAGTRLNESGKDHIAYCFHSVTGYSKFGSYTGNGSTTGASVTTGFKVGFLLTKCVDSATGWAIVDNTRTPTNPVEGTLYPDKSDAEYTGDQHHIDLNDNGFQIKNNNSRFNTNGDTYIYMAFADKREYAYWLDQSGNNNDWTSNNLTESDISVDSPTNNFATYNPLVNTTYNPTLSEGNLKSQFSTSGYWHLSCASHIISSGKYYYEFLATGSTYFTGVIFDDGTFNYKLSPYTYAQDGMVMIIGGDENSRIDNSSVSGTNIGGTANGDIVGVAIDMEAGTLKCYKNNVYKFALDMTTSNHWGVPAIVASVQHSNSGAYHIINFGQDSSFAGNKTAQGNQDGNDIGDFYYTPPSGFLALCTKNLPDVAVVPSEHFNTVLWSGNGASSHAITGVGFQPDFTWIKGRSAAEYSTIHDAVRGAEKSLASEETNAEATTGSGRVASFDTDGFSLGASGNVNANGTTYVAWNWKANGSGSSNTNGSITSTVSANVDAGFSIVGYTGTGSSATVGHGLSKAPNLTIIKPRNFADNWIVTYDSVDGSDDQAYLNLTNAGGSPSASYAVAQNATTLGLTDWNNVNDTDDTYIAYCFHSVDGYSKVGSYTGNGNADGTFVYTGFRPAFILHKKTNGSANWIMTDAIRNTSNPVGKYLMPNSSNAEADGTSFFDYTSNGFKLRTSGGGQNGSGDTHIFIAFAETPFKNSNAR